MAAHSYSDLKQHIGHRIVCVGYGPKKDPVNVAVECETCSEVLMDFERPDREDKEG